ncbi:MAG: flavodoxin domain-containing protein [Anaerolineae bacterium]|nr:flavodoxin domain-containing protein [Caldilineales bacterium]MDW8268546.1 flavodoxin domain-containing protein [Anaerolineae bacterium]
MSHHVLVAYATKYGATAEIAERIAQVLRTAGLTVVVAAADATADLRPYTAVVLGSAVYAGAWRKEAVAFLEAQAEGLAQRPLWRFSSGPTGQGDPVALLKGWRFPDAQRPLLERIRPRDIALFHGRLDPARLNLAERLLIKGIKAPTGDFRDWPAIEAWAQGIADALGTTTGPA